MKFTFIFGVKIFALVNLPGDREYKAASSWQLAASGWFSLPAFCAYPVQLQLVRLDNEAVTVGHLGLEFFNGLVLEFDNGPAVSAYQVIVVLTLGHMLVTGLTVAELDFPGDPRLGEEFQGAVDRCIADPGMLYPQFQVEIFNTHMTVRGEEGVKDHVPLSGRLESLVGDEVVEYFLLGPFHKYLDNESDFHYMELSWRCQHFFI